MRLALRLESLWWRRPEPPRSIFLNGPLTILSWLYRLGAAIARAWTRPRVAGVPVISIGNLAVGGT
ncbi:MAG: tetraacyldisaccharide 4'-kinase, partial [Deltaproteobacteria bacterium]|nr:tetraacyldisaccharide 4'-kinase [Deltaproteobacteria bacterium]